MIPDEMRMRVAGRVKRIVAKVVMFLVLMPLFVFLFGEIVLQLWNWLMPTIFHLPTIGFWQAIGLLVLSWILLGGRRGMGGGWQHYRGPWRRGMRGQWEKMTPEEQEKFREWIRNRCGQVPLREEPGETRS